MLVAAASGTLVLQRVLARRATVRRTRDAATGG
jgi:hypothetical protein